MSMHETIDRPQELVRITLTRLQVTKLVGSMRKAHAKQVRDASNRTKRGDAPHPNSARSLEQIACTERVLCFAVGLEPKL